jgi:hypothetical protein
MNTIVLICICIITLSIAALVIYIIRAVIAIEKTVTEAKILIKSVNEEVDAMKKVTAGIYNLFENFRSPWFKAGSWIFNLAASIVKKRFNKEKSENSGEDQ